MDLTSEFGSVSNPATFGLPDLTGSSGTDGTYVPLNLDTPGGTPGFNETTGTYDVAAQSNAASSPSCWDTFSNSLGGMFGQIAGTGLGVGTQLADYGIASLGSQAARGIGQATGQIPPQYIPVPVTGAPSSSRSALLIVLALAGVGAVLLLKGK